MVIGNRLRQYSSFFFKFLDVGKCNWISVKASEIARLNNAPNRRICIGVAWIYVVVVNFVTPTYSLWVYITNFSAKSVLKF